MLKRFVHQTQKLQSYRRQMIGSDLRQNWASRWRTLCTQQDFRIAMKEARQLARSLLALE